MRPSSAAAASALWSRTARAPASSRVLMPTSSSTSSDSLLGKCR